MALPLLAVAVLWPASAGAHALVQRADIPIPTWLFGWGAALVLVVSFVGLATLWPTSRLEQPTWKPLPAALSRVLVSPVAQVVTGAIGVLLLVLVIWAGLDGRQAPQTNFTPTFVYVTFWVGLVFASVLFGDVFRAFNPWRASARVVAALLGQGPSPNRLRREYPAALGRWPGAVILLVFVWTELVGGFGDDPQRIAICAVVYSAFTWAGMAVYGIDTWLQRGEAFSIYYNLFARLSIFETRDGRVGRRPPLGGLPSLEPLPGTTAFVVVMIGTVTYDGLSQGATWRDGLGKRLTELFDNLGFSAATAVDLAGTAGLLLGPLIIGGLYLLGIAGVKSVGGGMSSMRLRRAFVHTLVPIAFVYVIAHYLTLFVFQGQAIVYLISDPLGRGWNLFGTATASIDYGLLTQTSTWYIQVVFVLLGHIAGLILAHDRAIALYRKPVFAVRSQYWMLSVMVCYTSLALWLLSQANAS